MKLWLIEQDENGGYDTYDSAVVCSETEQDARNLHPKGYVWESSDSPEWFVWTDTWCLPEYVTVTEIGVATMPNAIQCVWCTSFNAG